MPLNATALMNCRWKNIKMMITGAMIITDAAIIRSKRVAYCELKNVSASGSV